MTKGEGLHADQLYQRCDPALLEFETTAELPELTEIIGQERALEAVRFGISIRNAGYNIFALGPPGLGKHSLVKQLLGEPANHRSPPSDWCYVNNFDDPRRPRALAMPPGKGRSLRDDMARLIEDLKMVIPAAFESDEYRSRSQEIEEEFKERQEKAIADLRQQAREKDIDLIRTPAGFAFAPTRKDEVISPEEFERLPEAERERIAATVAQLQEKLRAVIRQVPQWRQESRDKLRTLNREVAISAAEPPIHELRDKYADLPQVVSYLEATQEDIITNIDDFRQQEESQPGLGMLTGERSPSFRRYEVNLIVERGADKQGIPVLYEDNPTYHNLAGALEHVAMMGALLTDFTLIKAGALHRANGGYLLLDAHKVLTQPFAWEALKRALRSRELRIEPVERLMSLVSTVSLEPEPIPLDIKVIILGDRLLYYLLCEYDPDFADLFKVAADFEERLERTPASQQRFARLIATMAHKNRVNPFDRQAVARIIEHSSRMSGDTRKLSTHLRSLADLLHESDYYARAAGVATVGAGHVQQAIDAQERRASRLKEDIHEAIQRGSLIIDTAEEACGQVNGLSVIEMGGYAFGVPHRITARVRLGEGEVIDIEREVDLGGPLHSKGVMILSGFLGARYAASIPLSLSASLVFEQSYGQVEGDSASSAELYTLLSALAGVPVKQSLAVTGSVNQHGEVQAIGGVNEKIEGFFDICKGRGLSGEQGVLIPASNVENLMLRADVVEAARNGRFHIYPVKTIDEGMALLSGLAAGEPDADGLYPLDSFNGRVQARMQELAQLRQSFAEHGKDKEGL
ncbi:MAG: ATP-binding protein [Gammaproteobacteria bacterium]|jgi:lon-related putative ATP-dependent protease